MHVFYESYGSDACFLWVLCSVCAYDSCGCVCCMCAHALLMSLMVLSLLRIYYALNCSIHLRSRSTSLCQIPSCASWSCRSRVRDSCGTAHSLTIASFPLSEQGALTNFGTRSVPCNLCAGTTLRHSSAPTPFARPSDSKVMCGKGKGMWGRRGEYVLASPSDTSQLSWAS